MIAILAAISIVAYTGVQNRAYDSVVQADLNSMQKTAKIKAVTEELPQTDADFTASFKPSDNANPYDSSVRYPLIALKTQNEQGVHGGYSFAALSKSGKVFIAEGGSVGQNTSSEVTPEGAIAWLKEEIGWYEAEVITMRQNNDPNLGWYEADLAYYRSMLAEADALQLSGKDYWTVEIPQEPSDWTGTHIGSNTPIQIDRSSLLVSKEVDMYNYNDVLTGYIYDMIDKRWEPVTIYTGDSGGIAQVAI